MTLYEFCRRTYWLAREAGPLAMGLASQLPELFNRKSYPAAAQPLLDGFKSGQVTTRDYDNLFLYFVQGWQSYRLSHGAGAAYPGFPSWSGKEVDNLEGFARIMPLLGAWCASGRRKKVQLPGAETLYLPDEFYRGLLEGTNPDAAGYWGDMEGKSPQRIVEAADVALALWFFRPFAWDTLAENHRNQVVSWLRQPGGCPGLDNNWHLFFVIIDRVLLDIGYPNSIPDTRDRWARIKEFHLGDGWFEDGPGGQVDFYNAWGFHYLMYWINKIDPEWDAAFITKVQRLFLPSLKHLLGPRGIPILGRSIPYRMALPAPLISGQAEHPDLVTPGEARRALDVTWHYFIARGAVKDGVPTQGYFGRDLRLLENYSGPASPLWSLRSLICALSFSTDDSFWNADPEPLPIESYDYKFDLEGPQWRVKGNKNNGNIRIEVLQNSLGAAPKVEPFLFDDWLRSVAYEEALRPKNYKAKYGRRVYNSLQPFCIR